MTYDDASWHAEGDFPDDLPPEAGATHMAMFVAWCMLNGLAGSLHKGDWQAELEQLESRRMTPGSWFLMTCDGKFTEKELSEDGNTFAVAYYGNDQGPLTDPETFLHDYVTIFDEFEEIYRVPDSWASYDRLAPVIARRFAQWRAKSGKRLGNF